jgi:lysophospholipase L1-like esterase
MPVTLSKVIVLSLLLAATYVSYEAVCLWANYRASRTLIANAAPYQRPAGADQLLVLGDSIAFGVGADSPELSVAGRVASANPGYAVENLSVIGARVSDLAAQLNRAQHQHYQMALISIGANDIIRFETAATAQETLEGFFQALRSRADKIVFFAAGNVGAAPIVPLILRPLYHRRTIDYHQAFEALATRSNSIYVNLYEKPDTDPFVKEPGRFIAADGLHPSSEGYRLYFERISKSL